MEHYTEEINEDPIKMLEFILKNHKFQPNHIELFTQLDLVKRYIKELETTNKLLREKLS